MKGLKKKKEKKRWNFLSFANKTLPSYDVLVYNINVLEEPSVTNNKAHSQDSIN